MPGHIGSQIYKDFVDDKSWYLESIWKLTELQTLMMINS
jgi:hypothetical protein